MKNLDKIDRELENASEKVISGKLTERNKITIIGLSKNYKILRKIARYLSKYCENSKECEKYIYATLLKYRTADVINLLEDLISNKKHIIYELKKIISEEDLKKIDDTNLNIVKLVYRILRRFKR